MSDDVQRLDPNSPFYQNPTALTDKAIERASKSYDDKLTAQHELLVEKIEGSVEIIKTRLDGNDTALVAALQAQKEAATKQTENFTAILDESKKGTTKQIDALNEKIDDLKERLSETRGRATGATEAETTQAVMTALALQGKQTEHSGMQNMIAIAAIIVISLIAAVGWLRPSPQPTQVQVSPRVSDYQRSNDSDEWPATFHPIGTAWPPLFFDGNK